VEFQLPSGSNGTGHLFHNMLQIAFNFVLPEPKHHPTKLLK
jgi:hypothetical protein